MFKPPNKINEMLNQQYHAVDEANSKVAEIWLDHMVFSTGWWVSVALCILPWVIWFYFRKKDSSKRLLTGGFWVMFIATFSITWVLQWDFGDTMLKQFQPFLIL
ncbi:hypothetical protein H1D32_22975 [Anaerobacillus sp. CMMVII]|uniref:hypothetical protein n=1 Tax=Anaerobacillus sp. CMMVII TaxID=2755588 RepID=UPI0021B70798|nr:hypothetical protein [Anaerobacillus sp. CMMVII]MCT8140307.1 hypothetical protein [Anaerobacillus sp. CMMVII]